ncbi:MAG: hypothetical protein P1V20_03485 [Verrucomicrobiales bacterium]|nr:hypothetical protein [Verrucomicrobiales bacterium]
MKFIIRFLYVLTRVVLLLLSFAFLSFYLVTLSGLREKVTPVVESATRYLPALLVPVTVLMLVILMLRYIAKKRDEAVSFGDILAGTLAVAGQIGVIAMYRSQGHEVLNSSLLSNIPNVTMLADKAAPLGMVGVSILQFVVFILYWVADPDKRKLKSKHS